MEPLVGVLAVVAGTMGVAVFLGAAGGAIHGRLRGELSLGALSVVGAYFLVLIALGSFWRFGVFGVFPLILTFMVGSVTTQVLETRLGVRPVLATPAALCSALLAGFLYLLPFRFGWWELGDPNPTKIAMAVLLLLIALSIWKRVRPTRL